MSTYELIRRKRDGEELQPSEIDALIGGYVDGEIPDYQVAAFLMAVYFRGMTAGECHHLTRAMAASGERVDLSAIPGFKVDKHSTGGVGDTTSLVLGPLVASCGAVVAKMTGRELGHTGGTVDKLEAIPGVNLTRSKDDFIATAKKLGLSIVAQSQDLAPADKLLYALRNVTATVDAIPLIASSIMSKKLAAGADGIVLDVKTGNGAFTAGLPSAIDLARTMVDIGTDAGRRVVALVTSMDQPLGRAVGNALEVQEAIAALSGRGPRDLTELVLAMGCEMLVMAGAAASGKAAHDRLAAALGDGSALAKFRQYVSAMGGDPGTIDHPERLPTTKHHWPVCTPTAGYVTSIDSLRLGMASKSLGAGRPTKEAAIDPAAGILLHKKLGDAILASEPLATIHTNLGERVAQDAVLQIQQAYSIRPDPITPPPLLRARVTRQGVEELA
ncbi:MAG: thymidine phosphorylase [Desulfosarcinaceae bacterium]|nr:thymidine phosphorylase [Desulfosarcinaceae bacterium]